MYKNIHLCKGKGREAKGGKGRKGREGRERKGREGNFMTSPKTSKTAIFS